MPADSRTIDEEGVLIDDFYWSTKDDCARARLVDLLRRGPYPARNPAQNVADLTAQVAANAKGVAELHGLLDEFGLAVVARLHGACARQRSRGGARPAGARCPRDRSAVP